MGLVHKLGAAENPKHLKLLRKTGKRTRKDGSPGNEGGGRNEVRLVYEFGAAEVEGELPDPLVLHHEAVAVGERVERPRRVLLPHVYDDHLRGGAKS